VRNNIFQTFGTGPNHDFDPVVGGITEFNLERLRLSSRARFSLKTLGWISPYYRAIVATALDLDVNAGPTNPTTVVPIEFYDLRFIAREDVEPRIGITNATIVLSRVRRLAGGFAEWSGLVTRLKAERELPLQINGREQTFVLVAVGYVVDTAHDCEGAEETVLRPGIYKLYVKGRSVASFPNSPSTTNDWSPIAKKFRVIAPRDLRPYLRYATNGDERIFGIAYKGWNPNPNGVGFGHYTLHRAVVRAKVGYLSKIFQTVWVSPSVEIAPFEIPVRACTDGTYAGNALSQEWQNTYGGVRLMEEEFAFDPPATPGNHTVKILARRGGIELEQVDTWSYRVSRFTLPSEHLRPLTSLISRTYGPFGSRTIRSGPVEIAAGGELGRVNDAQLSAGWALPRWIQFEGCLDDVDVGLSFLRIFDWIGLFEADALPFEERLFTPPGVTEICLVMDTRESPAAFLFRTPEPVDWRRITIDAVQGNHNRFNRRFLTKLVPAPDGCSCLVMLVSEKVAVRVPRGIYSFRVAYHYIVASGR
jgi:hypothetical protein